MIKKIMILILLFVSIISNCIALNYYNVTQTSSSVYFNTTNIIYVNTTNNISNFIYFNNTNNITNQVYINFTTIINQTDINESDLIFEVLRFNKTSGTPINLDNGTCYFTDGTDPHYNCVMNSANGVILQLGEEMYYPNLVKNVDNVVLNNCKPVRLTGSYGVNVLIKRANMTSYRQAQATIGLTTEQININSFGRVTTFGSVNDCDTSAWNEGDSLYLNSTGDLTNVPQPKDIPQIFIGTVTRSHATIGSIAVNIVFNPSLDDLTYVNSSNINNEILVKNNVTGLWYSQNIQNYNDTGLINSINQTLSLNVSDIFNNFLRYTDNDYLFDGLQTVNFNDTKMNNTINQICSIYNYTTQINNLRDLNTVMKEPTGFPDRSTTLSFNLTTRQFNISQNGGFNYYVNGTKCFVNSSENITIPNTIGLHFIYYQNDCSNLKTSLTPWGFENYVQVATVYYNGVNYLLNDERHGLTMDWATHQYLHNTVNTRYSSGLTPIFQNYNFTIGSGSYYDEDLNFNNGEYNNCTLVYRNTSNVWQIVKNSKNYTYVNSTGVYYDNSGVLTLVPANNYFSTWVFATNEENKYLCLIGQSVDITLANARANQIYSSLSLTNLPTMEMKLLYRIISRNDATPYEETTDYRTSSDLTGSNLIGTSHSSLTGLLNDDHPQYLLVDGTRNMTGNLLFNSGFGVDSSFILNPYWLNLTDQTYNDSVTVGVGLSNTGTDKNPIINLNNTGVNAGVYGGTGNIVPIITIDSMGRITSATNGTHTGDISGITTSTTSGLQGGCTTGTCTLLVNQSYLSSQLGNWSFDKQFYLNTTADYLQDYQLLNNGSNANFTNLTMLNGYSLDFNIAIDGNFTSSTSFPNSPLYVSGNTNSYLQSVYRNRNSGNSASVDIVLVNNLGNDTRYYLDLGKNSNTFNDTLYSLTKANDGYLIDVDGDLVLGTATPNKNIIIGTGGWTADKLRINISDTLVLINNSVTLQVSNISLKRTSASNSSILDNGTATIITGYSGRNRIIIP